MKAKDKRPQQATAQTDLGFAAVEWFRTCLCDDNGRSILKTMDFEFRYAAEDENVGLVVKFLVVGIACALIAVASGIALRHYYVAIVNPTNSAGAGPEFRYAAHPNGAPLRSGKR